MENSTGYYVQEFSTAGLRRILLGCRLMFGDDLIEWHLEAILTKRLFSVVQLLTFVAAV